MSCKLRVCEGEGHELTLTYHGFKVEGEGFKITIEPKVKTPHDPPCESLFLRREDAEKLRDTLAYALAISDPLFDALR
jgi:hypothetical protein